MKVDNRNTCPMSVFATLLALSIMIGSVIGFIIATVSKTIVRGLASRWISLELQSGP